MFRTKRVVFFLAPGLLLLLVFCVIPFIGGIRYSLTDGSVQNRFAGLDNYRRLWQNPIFRQGLRNSLELSLLGAPLLWLLSFGAAAALTGLHPRGGFARSAVLLPYLAPASAMVLVWQVFFDFGGPVNRLLSALGLQRVDWLSGGAVRWPILLLFLWKNLGLCMVVFFSALRAVPASLYEAAELEGISRVRRLFSITLPLILPSAYLVFILSWINAFKIFREVYFLTGAYPAESVYTLQHYLNNVYGRLNYQMVTAAAYSFAAIVLVLFGVLFFLQQRAADELGY